MVVAAVLLALGVGAKLYPVALAPMFVLIWSRTRGWRWAMIATITFLVVAVIVLWPMVPAKHGECPQDAGQPVADGAVPPLPVDTTGVEPQDPSGGLKAFLRRWEMT